MTTEKKIRLATEADCEACLAIYAPYVRETVISFEYEAPTPVEFSRRMANILSSYPWLVCEIDGVIAGYAYASRYSERAAYGWSVDAAVYIHPEYHRRKIASALYEALFELLKIQGFYNVYAGITASNTRSIEFHTVFGFTKVGVFKNVGYKFDRWLDVQWMQRSLNAPQPDPAKPKNPDQIRDIPEFTAILNRAVRGIKD